MQRNGVLLTAGDPALMTAYDLLATPVLVVSDLEEPTIAFNQAAREFFGVDPDATRFFLKEHYKALLDTDLELGLASLADGNPAEVLALVSNSEGRWFRAVINAQPLPPREVPTIGAVISVQIQNEDEAPAQDPSPPLGTFAPQGMLESLVWRAPNVGVSITPDATSSKLIWNEGMYGLLGIEDPSVPPSQELFLAHVHPEDHPILTDLASALFVDGLSHWEGDFRLVSEEEKEVLVNAWVISQVNSQGSRGMASLIVSVEDEMLASREAVAARRELEKFTYTISHDLRAPVRHIESFMTLLLDSIDERLGEEEQLYAAYARQSVQKLAGMIQGMVDYSRLPHTLAETQDVDLGTLISNLIATQFSSAAARFEIGDLPVVRGRAPLLEKLFAHLISNAIKFSRFKPDSPISITCPTQTPKVCTVEVRDRGVGFESQHTDKLFEIFQRLHGVQEFAGLGIGLALSKRIVELHGGEISVLGQLGEGTRVSMTLPNASTVGETKTPSAT